MNNMASFAKKYAQSLIAISLALIVIFFTLNFLHTKFGGNAIGGIADKAGGLISGQAYNF